MDRLQSDPEWVRQNAEREAKEKARIAQRLKDIEPEHVPLLAELAAAGVQSAPEYHHAMGIGRHGGSRPRSSSFHLRFGEHKGQLP